MTDIKLFTNSSFGSVRVIMRENDPWFVAADVCKCLEHSNPTTALVNLDEDEKAKESLGLPGGDTNIISESGLYTLVIRSNKPEAKEFRRWVTHEVLPSIRKTGMYMPDFDDPVAAARAWADAEEKRILAERAAKENRLALQEEQAAHAVTTSKLETVTLVAGKLAASQGLAGNFRKVKAVPWLKDYFVIDGAKSPFYGNCGKYMTMICRNRGFAIEEVDDEDWGKVKAYQLEAWEYLRQLLDSGVINASTKYIGKYLR